MTVLVPPLLPDDEVLLIAALRSRPPIMAASGARIGTILSGTFPAVRVALTGGQARPVDGTGSPTLQVECWGRDATTSAEGEASLLARTVDAHIPGLRGEYGAVGTIVGAWRIGHILKQPDSGQARYIVNLGLITQGATA